MVLLINAGVGGVFHHADALLTQQSSYQYSEESSKGSIEPGKLADLVILSGNPLTVPVDAIKDIKIVETFKEGKSIYKQAE